MEAINRSETDKEFLKRRIPNAKNRPLYPITKIPSILKTHLASNEYAALPINDPIASINRFLSTKFTITITNFPDCRASDQTIVNEKLCDIEDIKATARDNYPIRNCLIGNFPYFPTQGYFKPLPFLQVGTNIENAQTNYLYPNCLNHPDPSPPLASNQASPPGPKPPP